MDQQVRVLQWIAIFFNNLLNFQYYNNVFIASDVEARVRLHSQYIFLKQNLELQEFTALYKLSWWSVLLLCYLY